MSSTQVDHPVVSSYPFADVIANHEALRELMGTASQGSLDKEIDYIDPHSVSFIAHSPFVLIATSDASGRVDVSPKGDPAGFVQVLNEKTLIIPERPGNRIADTLTNIVAFNDREQQDHRGVELVPEGGASFLQVLGSGGSGCFVHGFTWMLVEQQVWARWIEESA